MELAAMSPLHELNYKHLRYFWMVARVGTIAGAARLLRLSPHAISAQLGTFEAALGVSLFRRTGRRLELTEAGERILGHADEIFALGDQIDEILRDGSLRRGLPFRIGITDSVPKSIVVRLVEPALRIERPGRLVCREGALTDLLGELAVHRLDLVIADRPVPAEVSIRAFGSLLDDSSLTAFAAIDLARRLTGEFPQQLDGAPFLLPGVEVAFRAPLQQWFEASRIRPQIVAEFDDSALMKALGQSGAGVFVAPTVIADYVRKQYGVVALGEIADVRSQVHAITTERRQSHPAMAAIRERAARGLDG
jgi:LysR family transcriptional activator of nhaA